MKKIILVLSLILLAGSARAQSAAEVLAAFNAGVCDAFNKTDGCTDGQVLAEYCTTQPQPCVDNRTAEQRIYTTVNAFSNAVLLPPRQKAVFEQRWNIIISRLIQNMKADRAKCIAALTGGGIADQTVCK